MCSCNYCSRECTAVIHTPVPTIEPEPVSAGAPMASNSFKLRLFWVEFYTGSTYATTPRRRHNERRMPAPINLNSGEHQLSWASAFMASGHGSKRVQWKRNHKKNTRKRTGDLDHECGRGELNPVDCLNISSGPLHSTVRRAFFLVS